MSLRTKWRGLRAWCWWTWRRATRALETAQREAENRGYDGELL